jgi:uncharacterized membrane protein
VRAPSATGVVLATAAWLVGWLPSLLPGGTLLHGVALGVVTAIGYGLGATIGAVARLALTITGRRIRPPESTKWPWVLVILALVIMLLGGAFMVAGINQQALEMAATSYTVTWPVASAIGVVMTVLLLAIGRGVRALTRVLATKIANRMGHRWVADGIAFTFTAAGFVAVLGGAMWATQEAFNRIDASSGTLSAPQSATRSGSPDSLISFASLGKEGRQFVTHGDFPSSIRAFAGLQSAPTAQTRAEIAVADMLRAGGADADIWVGITTTGNGFIDPVAARAVDKVTAGKAALVAIQYSTLPSWLSFLVNQGNARQAGIATFDALTAARERLPPEKRPRLVLYGESLGAFGSPAPFADMTPQEVVAKVDGALWVGPPAATNPITEWTYDGALPVWQPTVTDGRPARYAATAVTATDPPGQDPWTPPRILILQNPTDPVVWFAPSLLFRPAVWLNSPRGPSVQSGTTWTPVLFFFEVAMDLPQAVSMPPGYGHNYSDALETAWRQVLTEP